MAAIFSCPPVAEGPAQAATMPFEVYLIVVSGGPGGSRIIDAGLDRDRALAFVAELNGSLRNR